MKGEYVVFIISIALGLLVWVVGAVPGIDARLIAMAVFLIFGIVMSGVMVRHRGVEDALRYQGFHDVLTGLYNRAFFEEELKRLDTERQLPLSVIVGDLNGLKVTNDTFGHAKGDELLRKTAQVFKEVCRKEDVIARWGGDEFFVILPQTDEKMAADVCSRIRKACAKIDPNPIPLSVALGSASKARPDQDIREVIREAEDRMYPNKILNEESVSSSVLSSLQAATGARDNETKEQAQRGNCW